MINADLNLFPVLFIVLCLATAVQLFYYLFFYLAPAVHKPLKEVLPGQPVSVIICARNEAENLIKFLPSVLEQKYPSYEVIVVNDCSEDNSDDILGQFLSKYPNLHISSINKDPKFTHSKKFAQFIGIKAAKNDLLLLTDADCEPSSENWISLMSSGFGEKTEIVLGYGGYLRKKGILNRYIRYDTMVIAMQYLGMAIRGVPYMGVGRNLAYRKSLFFLRKGFGNHNSVMSGDDDLFVNANASGNNTNVVLESGSITRSVAASTVKEWVKQKVRHFSTAGYYKFRDKFFLISEPFTRVLFYFLAILLAANLFMWPYVLAIFGLRLIIMITVLTLVSKRLDEKGMVPVSIFFDIFSPVINIALYLSMLRNRSHNIQWK